MRLTPASAAISLASPPPERHPHPLVLSSPLSEHDFSFYLVEVIGPPLPATRCPRVIGHGLAVDGGEKHAGELHLVDGNRYNQPRRVLQPASPGAATMDGGAATGG